MSKDHLGIVGPVLMRFVSVALLINISCNHKQVAESENKGIMSADVKPSPSPEQTTENQGKLGTVDFNKDKLNCNKLGKLFDASEGVNACQNIPIAKWECSEKGLKIRIKDDHEAASVFSEISRAFGHTLLFDQCGEIASNISLILSVAGNKFVRKDIKLKPGSLWLFGNSYAFANQSFDDSTCDADILSVDKIVSNDSKCLEIHLTDILAALSIQRQRSSWGHDNPTWGACR